MAVQASSIIALQKPAKLYVRLVLQDLLDSDEGEGAESRCFLKHGVSTLNLGDVFDTKVHSCLDPKQVTGQYLQIHQNCEVTFEMYTYGFAAQRTLRRLGPLSSIVA